MTLAAKIQALLYWKGEPMSRATLGKILFEKEKEIDDALLSLQEKLKDSGLILVINGDEVSLGTDNAMSDIIEGLAKEEISGNLGKASLETLTLILYRGPISKSKIDNIRGVNSSFILRNLSIRGLVRREKDLKDERIFLYSPTMDLLFFLGIKNVKELPEYAEKSKEFDLAEKQTAEQNDEV